MTAQTLGDAVSKERLIEIGQQYIEVLADDADPNTADFRRDVSISQAREVGEGPEAWWAYVCLHYFVWREQMYCRICGCQVLAGWLAPHFEKLHRYFGGF